VGVSTGVALVSALGEGVVSAGVDGISELLGGVVDGGSQELGSSPSPSQSSGDGEDDELFWVVQEPEGGSLA
jgi:hypothetical protein